MSCTRPRLTIIHLSEGHGGRMVNGRLNKHLWFPWWEKIQNRKWTDTLWGLDKYPRQEWLKRTDILWGLGIQDNNSPKRTYLVNIWVGYAPIHKGNCQYTHPCPNLERKFLIHPLVKNLDLIGIHDWKRIWFLNSSLEKNLNLFEIHDWNSCKSHAIFLSSLSV